MLYPIYKNTENFYLALRVVDLKTEAFKETAHLFSQKHGYVTKSLCFTLSWILHLFLLSTDENE